MTRPAETTRCGVVRAKPGGRTWRSRTGSSRASVAPLRRSRRSRAFSTSSGLVADREDLARFLHLDGDAFGLEQVDHVLDAEGGEGGVKESAGRPIGGDDAALVGGVGEIAARAAGHEDLDAGLAVLFQQQHAPAEFGRAEGGHQPGRAGPDHDHVPDGVRHERDSTPLRGTPPPHFFPVCFSRYSARSFSAPRYYASFRYRHSRSSV